MSSPIHRSHLAAQDLFDRTVDDYRQRAEAVVHNTSSLMFARRKEVTLDLLDSAGIRDGTVLDFGMGPGVFASDVVSRGLTFIGVDISSEMVREAEGLGIEGATYVQGDLEVLESYKGDVDVVLAIGLIDYLEEVPDGIQRLVQCLRPGGFLIVSFRNDDSVGTRARTIAKSIWRRFFSRSHWRRDSAFVAPVHEKSFRAPELESLLARAGLRSPVVAYLNFSPLIFFNLPLPDRLWEFWRRADRVLARPATRWGCSAGLVRAQRAGDPQAGPPPS